MITVPSVILFFAVRYALGRQSYAPSLVADVVRENLKQLETTELEAILQETYQVRNLGMPCDVEVWRTLREDIRKELAGQEVKDLGGARDTNT